jgi:5'-3' exonuclease
MRLKKAQREKVLELIAAGAKTDEINAAGAVFESPFQVSRQQVNKYRTTRRVELKAILSADEKNALATGLALREKRVIKLQQIAALMEHDLFGGFLWTEEVKGVGSGTAAEIVEYDQFNAAEVMQYRGVLDDIAKEVGERKDKSAPSLSINIEGLEAILDKVYGHGSDPDS